MRMTEEARQKWTSLGYQFNGFGTPYKPLPPDTVIGYDHTSYDEDGEIAIHLFRCAWHEKAEDWQGEGDRTITVQDTWQKQYSCDRIGCELNYYQQPQPGQPTPPVKHPDAVAARQTMQAAMSK